MNVDERRLRWMAGLVLTGGIGGLGAGCGEKPLGVRPPMKAGVSSSTAAAVKVVTVGERAATAARLTRLASATEGTSLGDGTAVVVRAGVLAATSGLIMAHDPLVYPSGGVPLDRRIAPGRYPVDLVVHRATSGDERTAAAILRIREAKVEHWVTAPENGVGDEPAHDEAPGYGVDSATGCFVDAATCSAVREDGAEESLVERITADLEATYKHTRSWADTVYPAAPQDSRGNVVSFSTGYGDGVYASYWGLDADGEPVCLMTDLGVV